MFREDAGDARLERGVDRQRHVARAREKRLDGRMARLTAMAQQRKQIAIVAPNRRHGSAGGIGHRDYGGVIVKPAQPVLQIALDIRGVARAPVSACREIADQMKRHGAERITPLHPFGRRALHAT